MHESRRLQSLDLGTGHDEGFACHEQAESTIHLSVEFNHRYHVALLVVKPFSISELSTDD